MTVTRKKSDNPLATAMGVNDNESHMTLVKAKRVTKADKEVLQGSKLEKDDAWEPFMFNPKDPTNQATQVLRPPYSPNALAALCQQNNTLGQMVSAMEVNIDGSGFCVDKTEEAQKEDKKLMEAKKKAREAEKKKERDSRPPPKEGEPVPIEEDDEDEDEVDSEDDARKKILTEFFDEPYPRTSFMTIRRNLRRDLEQVGYGFIECLRDLTGELTFLKKLCASDMRMVKLDGAVMVDQTVKRGGKDVTVRMPVRERRFAQIQGKKVVFFKEFGASRELNRNDGMWAKEGEELDVKDRATEVLFFKVHDDARSPYGVPRWINQIPSVLGSRKAEELNLDFFDSGGLPPALVIVQGGQLTEEVRKQLNAYLSGKGASVHRAGIVEVQSAGGSIDSAGSVRVTVERFGSERMQDSMFENYDTRCEQRVRGAFRMPPIFVGKAQDYSYATAFASYTVAEAQVFEPERMEFDEVINNTVMRELDPEGVYEFRSLPLTVNDVATQLEALGVVQGDVETEDFVDAVNELTGLKLRPKESSGAPPQLPPGQEAPPVQPQAVGAGPPEPTGGQPPQTQPATPPTKKSKMDTFDMMALVSRWCEAQLTENVTDSEKENIKHTIQRMSSDDRERFDGYCTLKLMGAADHDLRGAVELVGAASDLDGCQH